LKFTEAPAGAVFTTSVAAGELIEPVGPITATLYSPPSLASR